MYCFAVASFFGVQPLGGSGCDGRSCAVAAVLAMRSDASQSLGDADERRFSADERKPFEFRGCV
jgi:hypothetical protein